MLPTVSLHTAAAHSGTNSSSASSAYQLSRELPLKTHTQLFTTKSTLLYLITIGDEMLFGDTQCTSSKLSSPTPDTTLVGKIFQEVRVEPKLLNQPARTTNANGMPGSTTIGKRFVLLPLSLV